ncbi:hypothetical protein J7J56_01580 [candidate division WOR-3 bacterium]|nr:hypothetical protein [candidate division WOR-3 bacterium]
MVSASIRKFCRYAVLMILVAIIIYLYGFSPYNLISYVERWRYANQLADEIAIVKAKLVWMRWLISEVQEDANIERYVRSRWGMIKPGDKRVYYLVR